MSFGLCRNSYLDPSKTFSKKIARENLLALTLLLKSPYSCLFSYLTDTCDEWGLALVQAKTNSECENEESLKVIGATQN